MDKVSPPDEGLAWQGAPRCRREIVILAGDRHTMVRRDLLDQSGGSLWGDRTAVVLHRQQYLTGRDASCSRPPLQ